MRNFCLALLAACLGWMIATPAVWGGNNLVGVVNVASGVNPNHLVVYIANPPPSPRPPIPTTAVIDQRNQTFHPRVLAIVTGTIVKFVNSDRVAHNVFSQSPGKSFDLGACRRKN